ncbi:hypothetical protein BegalDRAFT_2720 [Beggiatoa alba B18LD]|uniref:Glycine-rich domain-containing protein-like n=1 Tax=Beggiatoa alba B18LD TaxID=395493 RepID=I3CIW8_9GAMM|nr:hypothetical protein [Beggiatoa alba]EIJ43561.1 hypothetical protein BegalDRAFT_2720 [Beggiatoa alba B18LD]
MGVIIMLLSHLSQEALLSKQATFQPSKNTIVEATRLVNQLDFTDQNATLISYHGWQAEKVLATEVIYRKWLVLHKVYNQEIKLAPNKQLDEYWHFHILDTRKYMQDCNLVFGSYLHHYPYFGLTDAETAEDLHNAFQRTRDLFIKHFGHDLIGVSNRCSSTSCR